VASSFALRDLSERSADRVRHPMRQVHYEPFSAVGLQRVAHEVNSI
jgi:hypothetical protein